MRFVHFSDTHLGFSDLNKIDPATGINQREQDFYDAWWHAIEKILELKPDFVIHAGDLFQSPRPNNRAIRVALEGIQKLGGAGIPFVVIAGNHSTPRIPQTGSIFESIALFPHVLAAFRSRYERFRLGECALHCIPHCSLSEELETAYADVQLDREANYQIFVTHGAWRKKKGEIVGSVGEFNEQLLENPEDRLQIQFDYIALGHYHKHLEVAENAVYSGSTERTSFNEIGYTSGLLLVDLERQQRDYLPIPSRSMVAVGPVDCSGASVPAVYEAVQQAAQGVAAGSLVHLELIGLSRDVLLALNMQELDTCFPEAFHVEKILRAKENDAMHHTTASIGSLPAEFERYLDAEEDMALDRKKLLEYGLALLHEAEHTE